ncbi:MAG TPA: 4-hydroxythreonine-4-phosphate dehydrogenase PdxA [Gammaproteobacteria bacterium]|nr:4-hydroxythreonine-4-phosphate dehydrogenase PdxA [Gammaproteobacteria bacterium]
MRAPLAITSGEPAGIGPELCVQLAARGELGYASVIGDPELFRERARMLGLALTIREGELPGPLPAGEMHVTPQRLNVAARPGVLDPANASSVLEMLDVAVDGCITGDFAGMVTAPVSKAVINDAGIPFTGHTEYLAARTHTPLVVMMLAAGTLRVALATTHLPLRAVADAITPERLRVTLEVLERDLRIRFRITRPRIAVLGLNPHAGEDGHLGHEDRDIIRPVVEAMRSEGVELLGPLPADTAFTPRVLENVDAVLAMYHDQGLPVLKYAGFGEAVNVTLGLPIVRTSVDHGTALDLAGSGRADPGSLRAAIAMAAELAET